ncbi:c-type cytochrome [Rubritalea tangerina]|uniref:C-type cytochrome n=1 Tax=Rubritalea tangerina TaxID=430798 RepID=A0ABW4Z7D3_9BACT
MKTLIIPAAATLLACIAACTQPKNDDPFAPSKAMAASTGTPLEDLGKGHAIFMRQCTQCHERWIPNEIPTKEWHKIVPGMAWNAGLSEEEERLVTEYVIAASKVKKEAASQN